MSPWILSLLRKFSMKPQKPNLVLSDAAQFVQPFASSLFADGVNHGSGWELDGSLLVPKTPAVHTSANQIIQDSPEESRINGTRFEDWLPFASLAYKISPVPSDYLFRPVLAIISDLPNRNGVGFPASELSKWNVDGGCQAYRTWVGKPMHLEHGTWHPDPDNPDPELAIGVIVDVVMKPLVGFGENKLWKVVMLAAIDKTKNRSRAKLIEEGKRNTYSMGALVNYYTCSYCKGIVGKTCDHIDPEEPVVLYRIRNELVYRLCAGVLGAELSSVDDPAYGVAASDINHIKY